MYSYGPLHMAEKKQDDQLEHTYSSYVRIRDVTLKTCQRRWTIERSGERGSGISVLAARHDDDDDDLSWQNCSLLRIYWIEEHLIHVCMCVYDDLFTVLSKSYSDFYLKVLGIVHILSYKQSPCKQRDCLLSLKSITIWIYPPHFIHSWQIPTPLLFLKSFILDKGCNQRGSKLVDLHILIFLLE